MLEWLLTAFLGFCGEFLRGLYADYRARSALRENGRLQQENSQLKELAKTRDRAGQIRDRVNEEDDIGSLIDSL